MKYYFDIGKYVHSNSDVSTGQLKEELTPEVEKIRSEISRPVRKVAPGYSALYYYWVSRANLGFAFTDFEKPEGMRSIVGKGCKRLFERIRDEYYCIVFSKFLPHNMREVKISEDKKVLVINIDHFRKFSSVISKENFVDLFLYKFDNPDIEKVVTAWVIESQEKFPTLPNTQGITISEIVHLIETYNVHSPEDLSELLRTGTNALLSKIETNFDFYDKKLKEFKELVNKEKEENQGRFDKENQLRDFLKRHPWIIDFTYDEKSVENMPSEKYVDVFLVNSYFGYRKGMLIELKLPDEKIQKPYRSTTAVTAAVTNALSQILDYVIKYQEKEREKSADQQDGSWKRLFIDAMIIIGNDMSEHIELLNRYLHNIEIKTYGQLYDDARRRLDMFAKDRPLEGDGVSS